MSQLAPRTGGSAQRDLVALLTDRALAAPDRRIFTFLEDGEGEGRHWNYSQLHDAARRIAAWLQERTSPGDRAVLLVAPGLDYIAAFFGCLYAGVIAVPAYPPRRNRQSDRLDAIVRSATPKVIVTSSRVRENLDGVTASIVGQAHWLLIDEIDADPDAWKSIDVDADSLAFLQYTSGSTGDPKGVMVSHRNLIHNLGAIQKCFRNSQADQGLIWLPPYHDMGLIGGILQPIFVDSPCVLMPPLAFIQRPARWLEAVSKYKIQVSGGPDFAYALCVDRTTPAQRAGLDLSSWRLAFTGAEPIRPDTLDRFCEAFGPYGFRREAFYPCYGLAEATLLVTGAKAGEGSIVAPFAASALENGVAELDDGGRRLVSSGTPGEGVAVVVVDQTTHAPLPDGRVGEIWTAGNSVARGYWNLEGSAHDQFHGRIPGDDRSYLRTGDLGFLRDGELFVTGRLKDLIILRGANVYPQDVETSVAACHQSLRGVAGAAFSIEVGGAERLAIVQELEPRFRGDPEPIVAAIRLAVAAEHDQQLQRVVLVKAGRVPRTSSGKVQRRLCRSMLLDGTMEDVLFDWSADAPAPSTNGKHPQGELPAQEPKANSARSADEIRQWIVEHLAVRLHLSPNDVDSSLPFAAFGLDSVQLVGMAGELEAWLGQSLPPTLAWDYPTIDSLSRYLAGESVRRADDFDEQATTEPLAIVGVGCRFPGAENVEEFWDLIVNGRDGVGDVPPDRWNADDLFDPNPDVPGKIVSKRGGFLRNIDGFDPRFFGISPREATHMDPQQRVLLEVAWGTFENAGLTPERTAGSKTGVFVGIGGTDYSQLLRTRENSLERIDAYVGTGNALSVAANRISFLLDLQGPSLAIDTACSSAAVALHYAAQSLRSRDCDMALAGGVNAILSPEVNVAFSRARMLSPEGRCASFDADANGYVRGEGCGLVLLKRLSDAVRDGDQILAVLRGTAVNQDGKTTGITAPNGPAQTACVRTALRRSGISPSQIGYVEAHGTGTPLGDPIEFGALQEALDGEHRPPCFLGSVKANVGHTETASGVASLIKVVLMLRHGVIPPQRNFTRLNAHIANEGKPFQIVTQATPWPAIDGRRIAGVSSFGFGGANAHLVVEEAPRAFMTIESDSPKPGPLRPYHVLPISAFSEASLKRTALAYADLLAGGALDFGDVCRTAAVGRAALPFRVAVTADSAADAAAKLRSYSESGKASDTVSGVVRNRAKTNVAFLFTGQGSQYAGMGRRLFETERTFRRSLETCAEILKPTLGVDLLDILYPKPKSSDGERLHDTRFTQPALFAFEASLADLWKSWGVQPAAVLGHSVGEYPAAYTAGVFTLEDGLRLISERARLMQELPRSGGMLVVFAAEADLERRLEPFGGGLVIAAFNGPESHVVAGDSVALADFARMLEADGVRTQPLNVSHAFHSSFLDPMLDGLERAAASTAFNAPSIPFVSNLTGEALTTAPDAKYWREHSRQPVQFMKGMNTLSDLHCDVLIEVGPSPNLISMGRRCIDSKRTTWVPSVRPNHDDAKSIATAVAQASVGGAAIDWASFDRGRKRRHVWLPNYSFDRERYWLDGARTNGVQSAALVGSRPLLGGRAPSALASAQFLGRVTLADQPFLRDHVVQGSVVVPGAAYLDLALAAAEEVFGPGPHALEEVVFLAAFFVDEAAKFSLQTIVSPEVAGRAAFQIFSRPADSANGAWTMHATGVVKPKRGETEAPKPTDVDAMRALAAETVSRDELYRRLRVRGLEYGPAFQGLSDAARTSGRFAVAKLEIPDRILNEAGKQVLHPAIGDLLLQLFGGAIPEECIRPGAGETYLPVGVRSLRVFGNPATATSVVATLDTDIERDGADRVRGDIRLLDADGSALVEVLGAEVQRIGRAAESHAKETKSSTYRVKWERRPLVETKPTFRQGGWLAFADADDAVVETAFDALESQGAKTSIIRFDECFERRKAEAGIVALGNDLAGVVISIDAEGMEPEAVALACRRMMEVVQAMAACAGSRPPRLFVVARNANAVEGSPSSPAAAAAFGFARVVANEHPEWKTRLIDLPGDEAFLHESLVREWLFADDETEIAFRKGERWSPRLISHAVAEPAQKQRFEVRRPPGPHRLEIASAGALDLLTYREFRSSPLDKGQVLIDVEAAGLNFSDVLKAMGLYPGLGPGVVPLGIECSGRIAAVGPGVEEFSVGDEVMGVAPFSFASQAVTEAVGVVPKPSSISFEEAAASPIAYLTAHYALSRLADVQPGERVLVHAGAGGVGLAAISICQHLGAEVFATAGSDSKRAFLRELGVRHVFDSRTLDFADAIREVTSGEGVDVVLNSLPGDAIPRSIELLRGYGRFLEIGKTDIYQNRLIGLYPFQNNLSYFAIDLDKMLRERPLVVRDMFREVMARLEDGSYRPLPFASFPAEEIVEAFRYMQNRRNIGKVVVRFGERGKAKTDGDSAFHSDGTYVVTGGLGGLGLKLAEWLAEHGAGRLLLLGRSAPSEEASATISRIEATAVKVAIAKADVGDRDSLQAALSKAEKPIRGVFHAAGVLDDGVVVQQNRERLERVLQPKVNGARHLHSLLANEPLDHFVLFSSVAPLFGSPGQSGYAAGNAYLDALAQERRSQGLPALSINWGPWADVGMAARLGDDRMADRGVHPLPIVETLDLFGRLLTADSAQLGVMDVEWPRMLSLFPNGGPAMFRELGGNANKGVGRDRLRELVLAADLGDRLGILETHLLGRLARILQLEPAQIDPNQPINSLGLDSLMAIELKNGLETDLGVVLPMARFLEGPSVRDLAEQSLVLIAETPLAGDPLEAESVASDAEPPPQVETPVDLKTSAAEIEAVVQAVSSNVQPFAQSESPLIDENSFRRVWEETFGRKGIGVHDDFFALGGHSLQAMRLAARLSAELGRSVSVRDVFLAPTIALLAERLSTEPVDRLDRDAANAESVDGMRIVDEPLEELVARGSIPPVDAAALTLIPASILPTLGLNKAMVVGGLLQDKPMAVGVYGSRFGRIAMIVLPRFDAEAFEDRGALAEEVSAAIELAKSMGARRVSLTGLLPSATDFGNAMPTIDGVALVTANATAAASVVLNVEGVLARAGRTMERERVAFVGLGSLGLAALRLSLATLPHPRSLVLCDLASQQSRLEELKSEIVADFGFMGDVTILGARGPAPSPLNDSTLIVGAATATNAFDVERLRPGTLIVDDSAPHCFRTDKAIRRMREGGDVLISEGGLLQAEVPFQQTAYVPPLASAVGRKLADLFARHDARAILGATFSSLLSANTNDSRPANAAHDLDEGRRQSSLLRELGFSASWPQCENAPAAERTVQTFRERFGDALRTADGGFVAVDVNGFEPAPQKAESRSQRRSERELIAPGNE